jgi:multidrug resistance efflux pump
VENGKEEDMQNILKNIKGRTPVLIVVVLVLVVGGYYVLRSLMSTSNGPLKASGTIEATIVNVSPEMAGKVKAVLVDEGQPVKSGQPLFQLDDTLLKAQQEAAAAGAQTAQAAYASAQAQYQITLTAARSQAHSTRIQDWLGQTPDYFDQPKWYFTQDEQIASAQAELQAAQANLAVSQDNLNKVVSDLNNADFVQAEQRLSDARATYLVLLQVQAEGQATGAGLSPDQISSSVLPVLPPDIASFVPTYRLRIHVKQHLPNNAEISDAAQTAHDQATTKLTDAQNAYNALLTSASAETVLKARAALSVAEERYQVAQDRLNSLQTGDHSQPVMAAAAMVDQSKNAAQQAQANLDLLNAQLGKLTVYAPLDGVILTRNVEPGEFVQPGAESLSMANINSLTITVYVPEDRYGQIHLGQGATVSVDSFPGQTFSAKVSFISDQAEFTPRNVQTVEGRSSTVYAVKLQVTDPQGKLKPGMPADVTFLR